MIRWLIALALAVLGADPGLTQEKTWKAGLGKIVITPEKAMWMSGYGSRDKPAQGKLTELWAKALVLEDPAGHRAVLITLDLIGLDRQLSGEIVKSLRAKFGFQREGIILSCSHTHCGPVVGRNLNAMYFLDKDQQQLVQEYSDALPGKITRVVDEAVKSLAPARLAWGRGKADFAVNRRTNKEPEVPRLREAGELKGPVDHDVPVLLVRGKEGVRGLIFGYACHATVLPFFDWCGDYPGYAQLELEKAHPGAIAMFWAGCGGDQNPLPRRKVELAKEYGRQLAQAVAEVVGKPMQIISGDWRGQYLNLDLPFAELPTRDQLAEQALSKDRFIAQRARLLLEELKKNGTLAKSYPYPIQAWKLGDGPTWVALGGEVVVEYALRIKKDLGGDTWVMGYANDVMAYIPSLKVLKEGGYEGAGAMVYYGHPTVWGPRIEELIMGGVGDLVGKVRAK